MPEWIGKTIGKVRIEKLLARGGMAEVYLGSHLNLERPVAIKLLHSYIEEDPFLLERFHREAKAVAGLRHSNIVQIFDFDTEDGHPYIVMEYLKGPTLATYLRHLHQRKKRLPSDQVARLLDGLTDALDYAHGLGVIHRDIKPGNIMLHNKTDEIPLDRPLTNDIEAIITDFGLVRVMSAASQTASGLISGTPAYMSPEQARGDPIDHRTDIYSLGVVLYEMLAGRVPFEADSTMTVLHMQIHTPPPSIPGIPTKVQDVMDRALLKNPDDRYQTSREMTIDFYRSIGMTVQADALQEPYPVIPVPIDEAPAPAEPEPPAKPELPSKPEPLAKPEPTPKLESSPKPEPTPKLAPAPKPEPARTPARNRIGIGAVIFAVIGLAVLGTAAYFIFNRDRNVPPATATLSTGLPVTTPSPSALEPPGLPPATDMVKVDTGTYVVGRDPADNYHIAPQEILLNEFWIDQYQTTNAEYQQYLLANPGAATPLPAQPGEEKHPVRGVTWDQADAYCKWNNKRLPKEAEWEAAGRGAGSAPQLYPWGNDSTAGGDAVKLPNQNTYEVGTQPFNKSPLGVFDMVGNVWEWVDEPYNSSLPPGYRILRGTSYGNVLDLAFRQQTAPDDPNNVPLAGFRCAADKVR
jgi:serine/threonine protein kinase